MRPIILVAVALVAASSIVGCALSTPRSTSRKLDTWLYIQYDNDRERWVGFPGGLQFTKYEHGGVEFIDNTTLTSQSFDAKRSPYITENSFPDRPSEPIVVDWLKTPQDFMQMRVETLEAGEHKDLEKSTEVLDGRSLDRYDAYSRDALGERHLGLQIWVDREARILVREREWISPPDNTGKRTPITGDYRIVGSGPSSIHDLGVPRSAARDAPKGTSPEAMGIVESGKKARAQFPDRFRGVIWKETDSHSYLHILYRSGERYRLERYLSLDAVHPEYHLPSTDNPQKVLAWSKGQTPDNVVVFDGSRTYVKTGPNPKPFPVKEPQVEVRNGLSIPGDRILLDRSPWGYTNRGEMTLLSGAGDDATPGCSVLKSIQGDGVRVDYHVDPEKDFRAVKEVWWTKAPDGWKKTEENFDTEFARLPGGQWYARKQESVPHQGQWSPVEMLTHVDVLSDLSETLFSGEEIVKGVKKVRTR